ncbi:MAG TPA: DUF4388 domain-containing protein, partial [Verrucomicrobiae bacterium]|nr:DUF4388 domain-containing protein [Verrucomicrobiae bacterium]
MSLVGNLEDLALGEILQIVSLSRKSGVLSLHSRGREGRIVFRNGQVTCAHSSTWQQGLGEVLIQKGVIDIPKLKVALATQERNGFGERLGEILVRDFGIPPREIEDVAREQVEKVIYSLFVWSDGTFDFELQDAAEVMDITKLDPLQFMLEQGLNPQYLAMEGSRIIDEQRHRGEVPEEDQAAADANVDFAFDLLQAPAEAAPEPSPQPEPVPAEAPAPSPSEEQAGGAAAVVVDDDPAALSAIASVLASAGYEVATFDKTEETLIGVDGLYRSGRNPVVVVDLVMPRMDGSGTLGGLELLKFLYNNFSSLRVVVVSDFPNAEAQRKIE